MSGEAGAWIIFLCLMTSSVNWFPLLSNQTDLLFYVSFGYTKIWIYFLLFGCFLIFYQFVLINKINKQIKNDKSAFYNTEVYEINYL